MEKRRKKIITPEKVDKPVKVKKEIEEAVLNNKDEILKQAKNAGLFKYNKMYRRWEIIILLEEYDKI